MVINPRLLLLHIFEGMVHQATQDKLLAMPPDDFLLYLASMTRIKDAIIDLRGTPEIWVEFDEDCDYVRSSISDIS